MDRRQGDLMYSSESTTSLTPEQIAAAQRTVVSMVGDNDDAHTILCALGIGRRAA